MPAVLFDPDHRLWLLRGPTSAYAVRLAEDDSVRHVRWSASPTPAQPVRRCGPTAPAACPPATVFAVDNPGAVQPPVQLQWRQARPATRRHRSGPDAIGRSPA